MMMGTFTIRTLSPSLSSSSSSFYSFSSSSSSFPAAAAIAFDATAIAHGSFFEHRSDRILRFAHAPPKL